MYTCVCMCDNDMSEPNVTFLQERIARVHDLEHIATQLICQSKKLDRHFPSKNSNSENTGTSKPTASKPSVPNYAILG